MEIRASLVTPRKDDWRVKIDLFIKLFPEWEEKAPEQILSEFTFPVPSFEAGEKIVETINNASA